MFNERSTSRPGQYKSFSCQSSTLLIWPILASLNQGNCSNGRKYSLALRKTQKPCSEIFVTSVLEVLFPRFDDFIFVFLYEFLQMSQLSFWKAGICSQRDNWFNPELCFTIARDDMNVNSLLFSWKEVEPVISNAKNGWTHIITIRNPPKIVNIGFFRCFPFLCIGCWFFVNPVLSLPKGTTIGWRGFDVRLEKSARLRLWNWVWLGLNWLWIGFELGLIGFELALNWVWLGLNWLCFPGLRKCHFFHNPLLILNLRSFGHPANWVWIGFVFSPPEGGFIVIISCIIWIYVHLTFSEIGFVLHKKSWFVEGHRQM